MDRIIRDSCRVLEHFAGRYYEGPDLPARFVDDTKAFALLNPRATAAEWQEFALTLARSAWQQAYARGAEWRERTEAGEAAAEVAEEQAALDGLSYFDDQGFAAALEEQAALVASDPLAAGVPGAVEALDQRGEVDGTFRVVVAGDVPRAT